MRIFIFLLSFVFCTNSTASVNFEEESTFCLSLALYFEARGEGYVGMRAVGHTIINRASNRNKTICETIFEQSGNDNYYQCAFSFYCDGKPEIINDEESWNRGYKIAYGLLDGDYPFSSVNNADHYLVCKIKDRVYWTKRMKFVGQVGNHCFYDSKRNIK
jgi:spore germination cell wall hydrolase CwlJ-like protein